MNEKKKTVQPACGNKDGDSGIEIPYGTAYCTGRKHITYPLGYQDAHCVINSPDLFVAIVCDGCSTSSDGFTKNQCGAILGADWLCHWLHRQFSEQAGSTQFDIQDTLRETGVHCFNFFRFLLRMLERTSPLVARQKFIEQKLLFTVIGLVITKGEYCIFGCGDGCFGHDNGHMATGDKSGSHQYLLTQLADPRRSELPLVIHQRGPVRESDTFWIASDGLLVIFDEPERETSFQHFLNDPLTCSLHNGADQTIRPFRSLIKSFPDVFYDDATIVVAKPKPTSAPFTTS